MFSLRVCELQTSAGLVYFLWPTNIDKYFKVAAPDVGGEYDSLINETM